MSTILYLIALYWLIRIAVTGQRVRANEWVAKPDSYSDDPPVTAQVSACVPARNEEAVIANCVGDILAQEHSGLSELILVDDCSDDATSDRALAEAGNDPRLRIIEGDGPPPGWMGKSAACWRAQQEASGEWLLFVDADVRLHPRALSVALASAQHYGADMVSWLGQLTTKSFWEHVLMPFIGDFIALASPLKKVNDPAEDDCLANGQFILIRRSAYDRVGGHEAIRESVIDDVSLSRAVKHHESGELRYVLLHSFGLMDVRMYDSLSGVWAGFSKNFYAAAKQQTGWMLVGMGFILTTSVLPFVALACSTAWGEVEVARASALATASVLSFRFATKKLIPAPGWSLILHPVAALVTTAIMLNSTLQGLGLRRPARWKGRSVS